MVLVDMVCLGAAIVTIITLTQLCPICSSTLLLGIGRQYFLYMHSSDACNHCCDGGLAFGNILKSDRDLSFIISVGVGLVLSRKIVSYMVLLGASPRCHSDHYCIDSFRHPPFKSDRGLDGLAKGPKTTPALMFFSLPFCFHSEFWLGRGPIAVFCNSLA